MIEFRIIRKVGLLVEKIWALGGNFDNTHKGERG